MMEKRRPIGNLTVRRKDAAKGTWDTTVATVWPSDYGEDRAYWVIDDTITEEQWVQLYRDYRSGKDSRRLYYNFRAHKPRQQEAFHASDNYAGDIEF